MDDTFSHKNPSIHHQVYHRSEMKKILQFPFCLYSIDFFCRICRKIAINVIDWAVACVMSLLCLHCSQGWQWQMVALDTSVVNISKYKLFVFTSDRKQICPVKLKNWTTFCTGELGSFLPPLSSISYLFKFNLVISYSKHLYNQRQRASWRDISDTSPPNFVGKLIFIIDDGGP